MNAITLIQDSSGPSGPRAIKLEIQPNTLLGFDGQGNPTLASPGGGGDVAEEDLGILPQNAKAEDYQCALSDAGKHIFHPGSDTSARTFTIPANSGVAFPLGSVLTFVNQQGGGDITVAITSDTLRLAGAGDTGSRTLAANGIATAIKVTTTEWLINGTGLS